MVNLPPLLTQADAQQRLANAGMGSLGLAMVRFGPTWSDQALTFDGNALTLTATGAIRSPYVGFRRFVDSGVSTDLVDAAGTVIAGPATVFELHPQAAVRLRRLVLTRLGTAAGAIRPAPATMVVRGAGGTTVDQWFAESQDIAAGGGTFSFHDERGLIVDPVAVAALFDDLATALPGIRSGTWPAATPGGVTTIAGLATGMLVHVVDPHGATFAAPATEAPQVVDSGGTPQSAVPASGLVTLSAGQGIGLPDNATRLRVGWARNFRLGRTDIFPPALPAGVTLGRQFLRACAVDLPWHLLGNRSNAAVQGIGAADQTMPEDFRPKVRDRVRLDYLVDGVDTLAAGGQALGTIGAGFQGFFFAAAPAIEATVGVPPAPGPAGHWPQFPAPPAAGPPPAGTPTTNITANWSGDRDVIVSFPGGTIAIGSHMRIYPQEFQVILSIGPQPSFLRGDGGAALVQDANPFSIFLTNPLRLPAGESQPAGSKLVFDLVVTSRAGARRTFAANVVDIGTNAVAAPADQFAVPNPMAIIPDAQRGIGPSPVFGVPTPVTPPSGGPPGSVEAMVRGLAGETTPRVGPRLPTMARHPTIVAVGSGNTGQPNPLTWDAIVSGGRWARETRSSDHALGNPGNPAGPDVHAPGVRIDGALAFDAAGVAMRRTAPILPFGSGNPFWLPFVGSNAWLEPAEPADDTAPPGQVAPRSCAAAVLRTVAVGCDTPELAPPAVPIPPANATPQDVANDLASRLGVPAPTVSVANDQQLLREIRREFFNSRFGNRDAQWALRRAVRQARDLVFICSPQFGMTADTSDGTAAHEVDLVAELKAQMTAHPALKVVLALPLFPDFDVRYGGWIRHAFAARKAALEELKAADANRVVAFHPVGFPGRPAPIRTTVVVVDDVWAMVGTSHWRRRGMTFDEGVDVVGIDRDLDDRGASRRIRAFRRALMARLLQVPDEGAVDSDQVRLASGAATFDLVHDLTAQQGLGRVTPFWQGPTDTDIIAQSMAVADPDGGTSASYLTLFAGLIGESP